MEITKRSGEKDAKSQISDTERWASLIAGGTMVLLGLKDLSLRGVLLAISGGGLVYHGTTSDRSLEHIVEEISGISSSIKVERTVSINKPAEELYRFWRDFNNLPRFMKHLKSLTVIDDKRSHWVAKAPLGLSVEWDAKIITD